MTLLWLAGCTVCGTFTYKGYDVMEECGPIYGARGDRWQVEGAPDTEGVVTVDLVPAPREDLPHIAWGDGFQPTVEVALRADHLDRGEELDGALLWSECSWWEPVGDPADGVWEVRLEPATAAWLRVGRERVWTSEVQRHLEWEVVCGEDRIAATGEDAVRLRARDTTPEARVLEWLSEGGD